MSERITLDEARRELGIKLPVRVELRRDMGQANASYLGIVAGSHRIAINIGRKTRKPRIGTWIVLPTRNATVWHELTHALQCERDHDGDSQRAKLYCHNELAERLGLAEDELTRELLHTRVRNELSWVGHSYTLDIYEALPWEVEARAEGAKRGHVEIQFPVSPKTRRDAQR